MSAPLHLTITTPAAVLVDRDDIVAVRAEDESGSFGILPGHADLLTVLTPGVVRFKGVDGALRYCALSGGVLAVEEGRRIAIACRQGTVGEDLASLEGAVDTMRASESDADKRARVEQMRLHAHAVRQLMHYLRPGHTTGAAEAAGSDEGPS